MFFFVKVHFQHPLLQSSVLCDPSETILTCCFGALETCIIIINVETSCTA